MARFSSRRSRRGRKLSHKKRRSSKRRPSGSRRRVSYKRRAAPARRSSAKSRIRKIQRSILIAESGADLRFIKRYAKEESHIWKPLPEGTDQTHVDYLNANMSATSGHRGNWPTGIEGTGHKIVHMNNFGINNYRRLHACYQMNILPKVGDQYTLTEQTLRNFIFLGKCTHKFTIRNMERQHHTLRISKMRCKKTLSCIPFASAFADSTQLGASGTTAPTTLFETTIPFTNTERSPERAVWKNWLETQDVDFNITDCVEWWLRPNTKCSKHPALTRNFKCEKEMTVRVAPGQSVTMSYSLPPKLVKYRSLLNNVCLKGDVMFMLESWGDIALLRKEAGSISTKPFDHVTKPVNMDFDSNTTIMNTTAGVDYIGDGSYYEARHSVVRDHGEWAILHEWTCPVQFINHLHVPTVQRHDYPQYSKEVTDGFARQTYVPVDTDIVNETAV